MQFLQLKDNGALMAMRKATTAQPWYVQDEERGTYERPPSHLDTLPKAPPAAEPELHERLWAEIRAEMAVQLVPGAFLDWVWPLVPMAFDDNVLKVACPDKRRMEMVTFRKRVFERTMHYVGFDGMELEFVLAPDRKKANSY